MFQNIKTIGFDADDTLWQNETIFRHTEKKFYRLLRAYMPQNALAAKLYKTEIGNLPLYGYGVKAFTLSMIETALKVTDDKLPPALLKKIMRLGKTMLTEPVVMLPDVEATLKQLSQKYKLVVATKGDILDQERKIQKSGISKYLHHIEIMSEKTPEGYKKLIHNLGIKPKEFLMVGNSEKSDILPVLEIGANAIHIPFFTTWEHERVAGGIAHKNLIKAEKIADIINYL